MATPSVPRPAVQHTTHVFNPNPGAMAGAEQAAEAQRRALLAAVAQQGQQGQQAFEADRQAQQQYRAGAVQQAASRATVGAANPAPAGLVARLQGSAGAAVQPGIESTSAANGAFQQEMARISASNSAYGQQVQEAMPIERSRLAGEVDRIRTENEAEADQRAHEALMREYDIKEAELSLKSAQEKADEDKPLDPVPIDQAASAAHFTGAQRGLTGQAKLDYARQVSRLPAYTTMEQAIQAVYADGGSWAEALSNIHALWNTPKSDDDPTALGHAYPDALALLEAQYKWQFTGGAKKPTYGVPSGGGRYTGAGSGREPKAPKEPAGDRYHTGPLEPLDPHDPRDQALIRQGKKCKMKFPDGQWGYTSTPCPGATGDRAHPDEVLRRNSAGRRPRPRQNDPRHAGEGSTSYGGPRVK